MSVLISVYACYGALMGHHNIQSRISTSTGVFFTFEHFRPLGAEAKDYGAMFEMLATL